MTHRAVHFHPGAIAEARAAAEWYRERNVSAADAFLSELDHAIEKISETPRMWSRYAGGARRFLLRRFPFSVIYREASGCIEIVAIALAGESLAIGRLA